MAKIPIPSRTPFFKGDTLSPEWARYFENLGDSPDHVIRTLTDSATPSVAGGKLWLTGGTTGITDFNDGVPGQEITIIAEHTVTITTGTHIFLDGPANWTMSVDCTLSLVQKANGLWYETGRGTNT